MRCFRTLGWGVRDTRASDLTRGWRRAEGDGRVHLRVKCRTVLGSKNYPVSPKLNRKKLWGSNVATKLPGAALRGDAASGGVVPCYEVRSRDCGNELGWVAWDWS